MGVCSAMHPTFPNSPAQGKLQAKPDKLLTLAPSTLCSGQSDPCDWLLPQVFLVERAGEHEHSFACAHWSRWNFTTRCNNSSLPRLPVLCGWCSSILLVWHLTSPANLARWRQRNTLSSCPGGHLCNIATQKSNSSCKSTSSNCAHPPRTLSRGGASVAANAGSTRISRPV